MKEYYLPPVIEKSAKNGYKPPEKPLLLASIIYYLNNKARKRGLFKRKNAEKIRRVVLIYYPVDVLCIDDKCIVVDPINECIISDPLLIGELSFLLQHPSNTPYLEESIVIDGGEPLEYSQSSFVDEYVIPKPPGGPGRYYIPFISVIYEGKAGRRVVIEPPIYYLCDFPRKYRGVKPFESFKSLLLRTNIDLDDIMDRLMLHKWILENASIKAMVENGLNKLKNKGVVKKREVSEIIRDYF